MLTAAAIAGAPVAAVDTHTPVGPLGEHAVQITTANVTSLEKHWGDFLGRSGTCSWCGRRGYDPPRGY